MKTGRRKYSGLLGYYAVYYVMLLLFTVAGLWPGGRIWGVNWYGYFSLPTLLVAMVLAALLPPMLWLVSRARARSVKPESAGEWTFLAGSAIIVIVGMAAFYFLRCITHYLGDGYLIMSQLEGVNDIKSQSQYGARQLQDFLYSLFTNVTERRGAFVMTLLSWSCGLLFMLSVLWAARRLFENNRSRILFALGVLSGGYSLMFFGYIENYPPFIVGIVLFGVMGLMVARGQLNRWWLLLPLLIAGYFHVFSVALIPAAVFLFLYDTPAGRWLVARKRLLFGGITAVVLVGLAVFTYLFETNYGFRFAFVPPLKDIYTVDGYWVFSWSHLLDYGNLLVMLVPALFFLLLLVARDGWRLLYRADYLALVLMILPSLGLVFIVDPKLGMPRDWDLMSFAGIPLALFLFYGLLDERDEPHSWQPAVLAIALGLLLLGPRVMSQHDLRKSVAVFDRITAPDKLRTRSVQAVLEDLLESAGDYDEVARRRAEYKKNRPDLAWLDDAIRRARAGHLDEVIGEFRKVIAFNPSHSAAWSNLGAWFQHHDQDDSALWCMKVADGLSPNNAGIQSNMGIVYHSIGDQKEAERHWKRAIELNALDYNSRENLLRLYKEQNRQEEYVRLSFESFEIGARPDAPLPFIQKLAELYLMRGDVKEAALQYRRAIERGLDTAVVRVIQQRYPELHVLPDEK